MQGTLQRTNVLTGALQRRGVMVGTLTLIERSIEGLYLAPERITSTVVRDVILTLEAGGSLSPARINSGSIVRDVTLALQEALGLAPERIESGSTVRGATFAKGYTPARVASGSVVRGVSLESQEALTFTAERIESATVVRGVTMSTTSTPTLSPERIESGAVVRGVTLTKQDALTLSPERISTGTTVRGVTLANQDALSLSPERITSGATVRGVTLSLQSALSLTPERISSGSVVRDVSLVVDGGGGENPYYDENADFYYELSDANDSNGGAHLTLANIPSFANDGVFGKCMTLNGTSQFAYDNGDMVVPYIATKGYSVRVRMFVSFSSTGNRCPIAFNGTNWCFFIRDTGVYEMRWRVASPSAFSGSGFWDSITLGQVYELVLEWGYYYENGAYKGCRAYLDGNLLGSLTGNTVGSADLVYPFFLGQFGNSPFYYFAGTIDEVSITTPCVPPV